MELNDCNCVTTSGKQVGQVSTNIQGSANYYNDYCRCNICPCCGRPRNYPWGGWPYGPYYTAKNSLESVPNTSYGTIAGGQTQYVN